MTPIIMPQIGQDIVTGTITRWMRQPGQTVRAGEPIATVEGDKATVDVEAPVDGVLLSILVAEGQEGKVLEPIGTIGSPEEMAGLAVTACGGVAGRSPPSHR